MYFYRCVLSEKNMVLEALMVSRVVINRYEKERNKQVHYITLLLILLQIKDGACSNVVHYPLIDSITDF